MSARYSISELGHAATASPQYARNFDPELLAAAMDYGFEAHAAIAAPAPTLTQAPTGYRCCSASFHSGFHTPTLPVFPLHSTKSTGKRAVKREQARIAAAVKAAMPPHPPPAPFGSQCAWRDTDCYVGKRGRTVYGGCRSVGHVQVEGVPLCLKHWHQLAETTLQRSTGLFWDHSADRTMLELLELRTSSEFTQRQPQHVCHARDCYVIGYLTAAFHGHFCDAHLEWMSDLRSRINAAKMHGEAEEEIELRQVEAMGRKFIDKGHVDYITEQLHTVLLSSPSVTSHSAEPDALDAPSLDSPDSPAASSPTRFALNAAARPFVSSSHTPPTLQSVPYSPSFSSPLPSTPSPSSSSASSPAASLPPSRLHRPSRPLVVLPIAAPPLLTRLQQSPATATSVLYSSLSSPTPWTAPPPDISHFGSSSTAAAPLDTAVQYGAASQSVTCWTWADVGQRSRMAAARKFADEWVAASRGGEW